MLDDYYLDEYGLASYFESCWLDKVRISGNMNALESNSREVPEEYVVANFHREASKIINLCIQKLDKQPTSYLEIGASLGRVCYEIVSETESIERAIILDPSQRLISNFKKLLVDGGINEYPYVKGLQENGIIRFDSTFLAENLKHVDFEFINDICSSETLSLERHNSDVVICLNVLDQCASPIEIAEVTKDKTNTGGLLALTCSYQWQEKKMNDFRECVSEISEYFPKTWVKMDEREIEYKRRINERFWHLFSSHLVVYQKP